MYPEINFLGRIYPTYGILGVSGVLLGLLYVLLSCKRFQLNKDDGVYIYTFGAVGAMIGAKLLYLILSLPDIIDDFPLIQSDPRLFVAKYLSGGMVFYGGFLGGIIGTWYSSKQYGKQLKDFFPVLLPALALAHAIGRLGCFFAGCCYGIPTSGRLSVIFTHSQIAPNHIPLVPVQLMEFVAELLIFVFLIWYSLRAHNRTNILYAYILTYAPTRFFIEFLRDDAIRGGFGILSTSQWVSLVIFVLVIVQLVRHKNHTKNKK